MANISTTLAIELKEGMGMSWFPLKMGYSFLWYKTIGANWAKCLGKFKISVSLNSYLVA